MLQAFFVLAMVPALYALWIVGRGDLLRLVQGVDHARATVVRHELGSDGYVPVYRFHRGVVVHEVRGSTASASPEPPLGTSVMLSHPRRRPDLARCPQVFARIVMYAGFAAWIGLFSDLAFGIF